MNVPLSNMMDRVVFGTVQIGIPYGRRKDDGLCSVVIAESILEKAWEKGIRVFDTAQAYGESSSRLANWLRKTGNLPKAHVVTKVNICDMENTEVLTELVDPFLGAKSVTLLTHGFVPTVSAWETFGTYACNNGLHIGQSVYTAEEIWNVNNLGCEYIQVPGNALDHQQINAAKACRITSDIRSVFLQGLMLDEPSIAEMRVPGGGKLAQAAYEISKGLGVSTANCLIWSVFSLIGPNDRVVMGADSSDEVEMWDWVNYQPEIAEKFIVLLGKRVGPFNREKIMDPRRWTN